MIDVYTGCILGMQIGMTATPDLAKRTFLMAMSDKTKLAEACGAEGKWNQFLRPEKVLHDSGNAYLAGATEMLCAQLRIDKVSAPKAKAFIRAAVERVFKTVNRGLLAKIPGKTFSNIGERGEYDSEAEAVMTLDDLIQVLTVWIVDIYHNDERRSKMHYIVSGLRLGAGVAARVHRQYSDIYIIQSKNLLGLEVLGRLLMLYGTQ